MKKLIFLFLLVPFLSLLSCSSDDNTEPTKIETPRNKLYPVRATVNIAAGAVDGILSVNPNSKIISEPRSSTDKLGYKGLIIYSDKNRNITAFDLACPNCWNGNVLLKMNTPGDRYECKTCGLKGYADYGFGTFEDKNGIVEFVKYEVTKKDLYLFEISNPK